MTPLFWLKVSPHARRRFASITDRWERREHLRGGFGLLEERLCAAWVREGRGLVPVDDYQTYRQIKGYASYESTGTWQDIFSEFADQMPDNLPDPQGSLLDAEDDGTATARRDGAGLGVPSEDQRRSASGARDSHR